jgi:hypothetical protein
LQAPAEEQGVEAEQARQFSVHTDGDNLLGEI